MTMQHGTLVKLGCFKTNLNFIQHFIVLVSMSEAECAPFTISILSCTACIGLCLLGHSEFEQRSEFPNNLSEAAHLGAYFRTHPQWSNKVLWEVFGNILWGRAFSFRLEMCRSVSQYSIKGLLLSKWSFSIHLSTKIPPRYHQKARKQS